MKKEYIQVSDNSGHRYIIPYEQLKDWDSFMEIPEDDPKSWEVPAYAEVLDGGQVIFSKYRIG